MVVRNRRAVTLVETIVVLGLLLILGASAMLRFGTFHTLKLHMAARKIVADLRYAQQVAMSGDKNITVKFYTKLDNPNNNRYEVYSGWTQYIKDPLTGENLIVDFDEEMYGGITIEAVDFCYCEYPGYTQYRKNVIFCAVLGIPYILLGNGNAWPISQDGYVRIAYKGRELEVSVSPETGEVSIRAPGTPCSQCAQ